MKIRILLLTMLPVICLAQVNPNGEKPAGELLSKEISPNEMKRNASFNVEEIKVRWKKAALENCTGVPCVAAPSFTCGTSTISDIDGNVYETVSIGTQCWTKTNLKVTMYNDGTLIPDLTVSTSNPWAPASGARTEYVAAGVTGYIGTFGYLYNWYATIDSRKLCPDGWHVPTDAEWTTLTTHLGGEVGAGGKMKETGTTLWNSPNTGADNTSGFSALPGGNRNANGSFSNIGDIAFFWSVDEVNINPLNSWGRTLLGFGGTGGDVGRSVNNKNFGLSVRCLKD